jgi:hypothetical protein
MRTAYYSAMQAEGEAFERYVLERLLAEWRVSIARCDNRNDQIAIGDTYFGLEIKFDQMFRETGNLCIEVAEKTDPKNPKYVQSGIFADSAAWLYGIGNAEEFFIFSKRTLRLVYENVQHRIFDFKTYETPTSRGFLIPRREITSFCEVSFYWGEPVF